MRARISAKCLIGKLNRAIQKIFPELQEKTATPTEQQQEITPDTSVYGLSKVTINRIPQEYIVPSGSIEITENGTYDVTDKASANVNIGGSYPPNWSEIGYEDTPQGIIDGFNYAKEIQNNWDSSTTNMSSMFNGNSKLIIFPFVDTSDVTNMGQAFNGCEGLNSIPLLDTSNVTNMYRLFASCRTLQSCPLFDTSNVADFSSMFASCSNLTDVPIFNVSKVNNGGLNQMFGLCTSLSNNSLNNILQMCINATPRTGASYKTLKKIGLSEAQATTCQSLSNYQAFLNAGWTTGY